MYGSVATGSFAPVATSCDARRHGSDVVCGSMFVLSRVMNEKNEPESVLLPSENEWFGHSSPTGVTSPVAPSSTTNVGMPPTLNFLLSLFFVTLCEYGSATQGISP